MPNVVTAEADIVITARSRFAGGIRHVIEIAVGVGRLVVDGRRQAAVAQRLNAERGFQRAGRAEQMTGHRFGRARSGSRTRARRSTDLIACVSYFSPILRRGCVGIQVADIARRQSGIAQAPVASPGRRPRLPEPAARCDWRRQWRRTRPPRPGSLAPRPSACSSASSTSTAAPSPRTKPSRSASNGRLARSGSSFRVESAPIAPKPATLKPGHRRFGSAGIDHIDDATPDHLNAFADRVGRRRARR